MAFKRGIGKAPIRPHPQINQIGILFASVNYLLTGDIVTMRYSTVCRLHREHKLSTARGPLYTVSFNKSDFAWY